jgi:outer membrane protein assembly factor BamB
MGDWHRRTVLATSAALAASVALASSGTSSADEGPELTDPDGWSSYAGTAGNTRYVPSDGFDEPETVAWEFDERGSLAAVDGRVYLRSGGRVYALDGTDGSQLWERGDLDGSGTPAFADGRVYVAGDQLSALDADTGEVDWSETFGDETSVSTPVAAFGTVYVTAEETLYAFDGTDGSLRWERDSVDVEYESRDGDTAEANYVLNTTEGTLAATNGRIWGLLDEQASDARTGADGVVALDPETGETQQADVFEGGHVASGIVATEEVLFIQVPTEEGVLVLQPEGDDEPRFLSDALATATAHGQAVTRGRYDFVAHESGWEESGPYAYGAPTIVGETVVVAYSETDQSTTDELVGFDLFEGTERWRFAFDDAEWSDGFAVDCVVDGDTVYVNRAGGLAAVRPADTDDNGEDGDTDDADESENSDDDADETDDAESDDADDEGGEEEPTDPDESDSEEPDDSGGTEGEDADETDADDDSDSDDQATENDDEYESGETDDDENETADDANLAGDDAADDDGSDDGSDAADDADGSPGFTPGVGVVGGLLGLEWLRRRAAVDEPAASESTETQVEDSTESEPESRQ